MDRTVTARFLSALLLGAIVSSAVPATATHDGPHAVATFTPPLAGGEWAQSSVGVALACSPATEGCAIAYSLDAGAWTAYSSSFSIAGEGDHSLTANASLDGGVGSSDIYSVRIDSTPPTVGVEQSCATPGSSDWCLGDVSLTPSASANGGSPLATWTCATPGATADCMQQGRGCDGPCPWILTADGSRPAWVNGSDVAGNRASVNTTVRIDRTAPVPASIACAPASTGWCRAFATVTGGSDATSGIASQTCSIGDRMLASCASGAIGEQGAFSFSSAATDVAGNTASSEPSSLQVDSYPPQVSIATTCASPGAAGWCLEAYSYTMSASDNGSGLAAGSPTCKLDGAIVPCSGTVSSIGAHTLLVEAADAAGHTNSTSVALAIDLFAPNVTLARACSTPGNDPWCVGGLSLTPNVVDDATSTPGRQCHLDDGAAQACAGLLAALPQGARSVRLVATDAAGRSNETTTSYLLDTAAPTLAPSLSCTLLGINNWCASAATGALSATDGTSGLGSLACLIDDADSPCSVTRSVEGSTALFGRAFDVAGNSASTTFTFGVDLTPPAVAITTSTTATLGEDGWYLGAVQLQFTGTDALSGIDRTEYSVDGRRWQSGTSLNALQGDHVYVARAYDRAGNVGVSAPLRLRVDNEATPRVLGEQDIFVRPFDDNGTTRILFPFSEPMDRASTEAALTGASGWTLAWGGDDTWLNLSRTDLAPGTAASVTLGTGATARHGGALASSVTRGTSARGPATYNVTDSTRVGGPAYDFVNITSTGTELSLYCDDCGTTVTLPFAFTVYEHTYTQINVSTNGFLTFDPNSCTGVYYPDLQWTSCARNLVAGYWEDLDPRLGAPTRTPRFGDRILTQTIGAEPNRVFIVSWSVVHHYSGADPVVTFQIKLFEGTNDIEVHYESAPSDGGLHMVGIVNATAQRHIAYSWGDASFERHAVRFSTRPSDAIGPIVSIALDPATPQGIGGWHLTPVSATISAEDAGGVDPASIAYSTDGTTFNPGTTASGFPEGETTLTARARDLAGNLGTASALIRIDTVRPTATASSALTGAAGNVTFQFSEPMDRASTEAALTNATGWTATWWDGDRSLSLTHDPVAQGTTRIDLGAGAKDAHGQPIAAPVFATIFRDSIAPDVTIALDPPTPLGLRGWHLTPVTATITATDEHGVDTTSIAYSTDGTTFVPGSIAAGFPEGETTLTARARDLTGNLGTASATFRIDTVRPTATATAELAGAAGNVSFQFSEPMDRAATEAALTNASGWTATWWDGDRNLSLTNASIAQGKTRIDLGAGAKDAHGQPIAAPVFGSIFRDSIPPEVTIALDPATPQGIDGWWTTSVNATFAATDVNGIAPGSLAYSLDGETWTAGDNVTITRQNETTLRARAMDPTGNVGTTSVLIKIDSIAPGVTPAAGLEGTVGTIVFGFSEPMNTTSVLAALTGATGWTPVWSLGNRTLTLTHPTVPVGMSAIVVGAAAADEHGKPLGRSASTSVTREPPVLPPDAPVDLIASLTGTSVRLGWSPPTNDGGGRVTSYRVSIDGRAPLVVSGTSFDAGPLARGATHTFAVTAVNSAGESPAAETSLDIPPVSTLVAPDAGATGWHTSAPTIVFGVEPSSATVTYDFGAGPTTYSGPFTLPDGTFTLRWSAAAGGVSEETREQSFRVDSTGPSIAGASVTGGEALAIAATVSDAGSGLAGVEAVVTPRDGSAAFLVPLVGGAGGAFAATAVPPPGEYDVEIVAHDSSGHESRASAGSASIPPPPPEEVFAPTRPTSSGGGDSGGFGGGFNGGGGGAPLEPASTSGNENTDSTGTPTPTATPEPAAPPPAPQIVIEQPEDVDTSVDAGARGVVVVRLTNVDNVEDVRIVLIRPGNVEEELGSNTPDVSWDTTTVPDGYYTIEARRIVGPAQPGELTIQSSHEIVLASGRFLIRNPVAEPAQVVGVAAGAVFVAAVTQVSLSAAASGASSSATAAVGGGFDPWGFAQEVAIDAGQDKLRDRTRERDRRRRVRSIIAAAVSLAILAPLWAFSETTGWSTTDWIQYLPIVGVAAVVVMAMKYSSESALAYATAARPRVRVWVAGALALAFSAIVFRNPFGYPAYVDETEESEARSTWKMQAQRGLATIAGSAAFMLPFLIVAPWASWSFVSVGLLLAVTNVATAAMPFGPLPGRDVWRFNKLLAVVVAVGGFALYVAFAAALAPVWSLWLVGLVGGAAYAFALLRFRKALRGKTVSVPVEVPVPVRTDATPHVEDATPEQTPAKSGKKRTRARKK